MQKKKNKYGLVVDGYIKTTSKIFYSLSTITEKLLDFRVFHFTPNALDSDCQ